MNHPQAQEEADAARTSPLRTQGDSFDLTRIPLTFTPLQRKPAVSVPGDAYEREADAVADQVMRMAEPAPTHSAAAIQRKCAECDDEEEKTIQTKPMAATNAGAALDVGTAMRATGQGGTPLPGEVRSFFEPRFGHDFSHVRVHADSGAAAGARAVRARAYTVGHDIVFASGQYAPATTEGKRLLAHELTHVMQQESSSPAIQRKDDEDCNLTHLDTECAGAAASCQTVKDYCAKKYPTSKEMDALHAGAVKGANDYKADYPNAGDNLLHFLGGSGKEKVMKVDVFRNHSATKQKYTDHMAKFKEGAKKRFDDGRLKIGGPAVKMVWTDTANAFSLGGYSDLGLAVGGYTVCSKVSAKALDPKDMGGNKDFLWVRFDPWVMQAFDCYNWDPGKGIGLPFATDNDLCCLENAGRAKHFRIRTDPWTEAFPVEDIRIAEEKPPAKPAPPPPPKQESDDR